MSRPTPEVVTHTLALVLTAGLGFCLLIAPRSMPLRDPTAPAMQIALEPEPTPPSPSPPTPERPLPEPPKARQPIVHREMPKPDPAPLMAAELPSPAATDAPSEPSPETISPPTPKSTPPGDIESQYAATLRSNIDSRTSLPTSTEYRLLKPHGEVRVNFTLDRGGTLLASELARSSGSTLLDHHALEIVRTGHYPPFPNEAFPNESRHTFLITLEFHS